MIGNTLGKILRLTTFGESHGPAVGAVLDGFPAGVTLNMEHLKFQMGRRKPGQSSLTTSRQEADEVKILSGVLDGQTTGAPIAFLIENKDSRSSDYEALKNLYRPGHADHTYEARFGIRDHRGGGRSSARTTAPWVAAGAMAESWLMERGMYVHAWVNQIGTIQAEAPGIVPSKENLEKNPVRCPDEEAAREMVKEIEKAKAGGDSLGGIITCVITGVPAGLGAPQFSKLSADLGHAMLSLNAVKGFEIGEGFAAAARKGSEMNDPIIKKNGEFSASSNHAGGFSGGMSNGNDLVFRVAFKPVASIALEQITSDREGNITPVKIEGRHDPCVVPRAVPIVEALSSLVIMDHYLLTKTVS